MQQLNQIKVFIRIAIYVYISACIWELTDSNGSESMDAQPYCCWKK